MTPIDNPGILAAIILEAIAGYNTIEVLIWTFTTFRHWRGLYFSSTFIATASLAVWSFLTLDVGIPKANFPLKALPSEYITPISYTTYLTAHALVLYSRLHLVLPPSPISDRILQFVLAIIIATAALTVPLYLIPRFILSAKTPSVEPYDSLLTRVSIQGSDAMQVVCIARESIICAIYIVQVVRPLQPIARVKGAAGKRLLIHLGAVQTAIIILDIGLLLVLFVFVGTWSTGYIALVYSLKVKSEIWVLNALVALVECPAMVRLPTTITAVTAVSTTGTSARGCIEDRQGPGVPAP